MEISIQNVHIIYIVFAINALAQRKYFIFVKGNELIKINQIFAPKNVLYKKGIHYI